MNLATLQNTLQSRILSPKPPQPGDPLGLLIYHNAYRARLLACMGDTYEQTRETLGDELFELLALAYIQAHPSQDANLGNYGLGFDAFILKQNQICSTQAKNLRMASELALIDWTMRRCFDSTDCEPDQIQTLAKVAPERMELVSFEAVPSLALGSSHIGSASHWLGRPSSDQTEYWRIWRRGFSPRLKLIGEQEHVALSLLIQNQTLGEIGQRLETLAGEQASSCLGAFLADWFADGVIAGLSVHDKQLE